MNKPYRFYRFINYIVLPVAVMIGVNVLFSLLLALTNPALLLVEFILACIPIYAFTANYFYNKGIRLGQPCKPSLKDWIRVNAIVSILFAAFMIIVSLVMVVVLNDPKALKELQEQLAASAPVAIPAADLVKALKVYAYFLLPYCTLLLIHIIITLRLVNRHRVVFEGSGNVE